MNNNAMGYFNLPYTLSHQNYMNTQFPQQINNNIPNYNMMPNNNNFPNNNIFNPFGNTINPFVHPSQNINNNNNPNNNNPNNK
jgi:hypothetical protein